MPQSGSADKAVRKLYLRSGTRLRQAVRQAVIKTSSVPEDVTHEGIMRANAEGGNRTLIPGGNTILSRARLPIPPLRLSAPKYTTLNMKVK